MSARHSPACGVLENGNLAVLGGFNAADPICLDACLTFDVKQADVAQCVRLMTPEEGDCRQLPFQQGYQFQSAHHVVQQANMKYLPLIMIGLLCCYGLLVQA